MSRIEIPLNEYNSLKDKINNLEETIIKNSKEINILKEKYEEAKFLVQELQNEDLISRMFKWKNITKPLITLFYEDGNDI